MFWLLFRPTYKKHLKTTLDYTFCASYYVFEFIILEPRIGMDPFAHKVVKST
jgi:hypothetical protein